MKIQSILAAGLLMMFGACTDLSENQYNKKKAKEYGQTDSEYTTIKRREKNHNKQKTNKNNPPKKQI